MSYGARVELRGLLVDWGGVLDDPGPGPSGFPLVAAVRLIRDSGVRTALVSNATSVDERVDAGLFDAVVISAEAGVAKPDPEIYRLAAARLGVAPGDCAFVDDQRRNVDGAVAAGMVGVHHRDTDSTLTELEILFELELRR